jgi:hypothetical protein
MLTPRNDGRAYAAQDDSITYPPDAVCLYHQLPQT